MAAITWRERLDLAESVHDVVQTAKDFASSLDYSDIGRLPPPCRPGKFFDAEDISSFAVTVSRYPPTGTPEVDAVILKVTTFFSDASIRVAQILATANDQEEQRTA